MRRGKTPRPRSQPATKEKLDWLARALGRVGVLPPDELEEAIQEGRVTLDGRVVRQPLAPVRPGQVIRLDGHRVSLDADTQVLMFHKPRGAVTSSVAQDTRPTVFDVLSAQLSPALRRVRWHAVGRLDVDTTGLLLFTNDEQVVAYVSAPESGLLKRYAARVQGTASDKKLAPLRGGITLDDGVARAASVELRDDGPVVMSITEGRHHQDKRMLGAVGLPVTALHREAIGTLELDVPEGQYRVVRPEELRALGVITRQ